MKKQILFTGILLLMLLETATAYDFGLDTCLYGRDNTAWYFTGAPEEYLYSTTTGNNAFLLCPHGGNYSFQIDTASPIQSMSKGEINPSTGAITWTSCGAINDGTTRKIYNLTCLSTIGLFEVISGAGANKFYIHTSGYSLLTETYSTKTFDAGVDYIVPFVSYYLGNGTMIYSYDGETFFTNNTKTGVGFLTVEMPHFSGGIETVTITNTNRSNYNQHWFVDYLVNSSGCANPGMLATSPSQTFNPIAGVNNEFSALLNDSDTVLTTTWRVNGEDTVIDGYMPFQSIVFDQPGAIEVEVIYKTTCDTYVIYTWSGFCSNYLSIYGYVYEEMADLTKSYLGGVNVVYRNTQDNSSYSAISGSDGYYEINHFTSGEYNISVAQDGYRYFNILKNITYNYTTRVRQDIRLNSTYSYTEYIFSVDEITNTATGTFNPITAFNLTVYNAGGSPLFAYIADTTYNYSNTVTFVYKDNNQISLLLDRYDTYIFNFTVAGYRCWLENTGSICSIEDIVEYETAWNIIFINESNLAADSNITITFKDTNNTAINRATVSMYYNVNNTKFGTGLTDTSGKVSFVNIPEAQYYWTLTAENFSAWKSDPKTIYRSENFTFTLKRIIQDYSIFGKVTACADVGIGTESPLSNVYINFTQGEMEFTGYTAQDGNYEIKVKKSNSPYYFTAKKDGFNNKIDNDFYADAGVSERFDFCLIKLPGYHSIEVQAKETNGTAILAVSNATIDVYKDGAIYDTGNTNFYGKVIFSLPTGNYQFKAIKDGYYPEVYPIDQEFVLIKADGVITINMQARGILDDLKDIGIPTNEKEFTKFIDGWGIVILIALILVMAGTSMIIMIKKAL